MATATLCCQSITGNQENINYTLNISFIHTFDVVKKSVDPSLTLIDYQLDKLKLEFVTYLKRFIKQS